MKRILGLVTARGGSKGVPGKNILMLGNKPLVAWTVSCATAYGGLDRLIVSTDDDEIADICRQHGAEVPFTRPQELSQDKSAHIDVVMHALNWLEDNQTYKPDYVLLLQPTSPFRLPSDVVDVVQIAMEKSADAVVSVHVTHEHPVFQFRMGSDAKLLGPIVRPDIDYPRRQDLDACYFVNGAIYLNKASSLQHARCFLPKDSRGYVMPIARSLQIDSLWDLTLARQLIDRYREPSLFPSQLCAAAQS